MRLPSGGPHDCPGGPELPAGPYHHAITVLWGDTDPAQIAYTANIPAWGLRAIEAWVKDCLGVGWYEMNVDLGVGTPFVDLRLSFHAPITPRHPLLAAVTVARLGRSSLTCDVEGTQDGVRCFSGRYVCVFVDALARRPIPVPPNMRACITRFAARQGVAYEDTARETTP